MDHYTDAAGLASAVVAIAAVLLRVSAAARCGRRARALLLTVVSVAALVPADAMSLAACLRGVSGDLSITTLVLLLGEILRLMRGHPAADTKSRVALYGLIVTTATVLYPLALGVGAFDPYRLGYGDPWFVSVLLLVALSAWWLRLEPIAFCIALAVLAWAVGWYESGNLWDYLLDPLLSVYAAGALALHALRVLWQRRLSV